MKVDFRSLANSYVRNLTPYQPGKPTEELERELGICSSIKLASNENPLGPSSKAVAAANEALLNAHIYPDGACFELKQSLAKKLNLKAEQITVGNGSENILELIIKAFLSSNSNAIISQYAFLTIPLLLASYNIPTKVVPAKEWGHDLDAMLTVIDEHTRIIFVVNPNNPTGTYVNETDFYRFMEKVSSSILVVIDEAYFEYISKHDYPDSISLLSTYPNLIITRTFSKAYGLAALRLGFSISSIEIADLLNRVRLPFNVNSIAIKAACAALEDQEYVIKSVLLNQQGMRQLEDGLNELKLTFIPSVANFISIDVNHALTIYQQLLEEGVIVRPLTAYQMPRHIRVTIGTTDEILRFLKAIEKILAHVEPQQEAIDHPALTPT